MGWMCGRGLPDKLTVTATIHHLALLRGTDAWLAGCWQERVGM